MSIDEETPEVRTTDVQQETSQPVVVDINEVIVDRSLLQELYLINNKLIEGKLAFADTQIKLDDYREAELDLYDQISELQNQITDLQKEAAGLKNQATSIQNELENYKTQKTDLRNALQEVNKLFQSRLNDIAKQYGIESNENSRWNFDFAAGKFVKAQ